MELSLSLNPDYWGPVFWEVMYLGAAGFSAKPTPNEKLGFRLFFDSLRYVLPCAKCRADYDQYLTTSPVTDKDLESRNALFAWVYGLHKHVSLKLQKPAFPTLEAMQYSFFPAQTAAQRIVWKRPVPAVILPKTSNAIQPFRNNTQIFRKVLPTNPQITRNVGNTPSAVVKQRLVSVGNTPNTPSAVARPASVGNTPNAVARPASVGNTPSAVARPASVGNTPSAVGIQRPASVVNQRPNMPTRAWVSAKTKPVSQSALDLLSAKLGTFREISQVPKYVKRGCGCRRN
jgi:hypothetical protein